MTHLSWKLFIYIISKVAYALCLDPLRHIPGPRLNAVSMIPYARHLLAGTTVQNSVSLHQQYGEVVRIAPNEVSLICGETAFPDIYGRLFITSQTMGQIRANSAVCRVSDGKDERASKYVQGKLFSPPPVLGPDESCRPTSIGPGMVCDSEQWGAVYLAGK